MTEPTVIVTAEDAVTIVKKDYDDIQSGEQEATLVEIEPSNDILERRSDP